MTSPPWNRHDNAGWLGWFRRLSKGPWGALRVEWLALAQGDETAAALS
jgi:hypothetical protein